MGRSKNYSGRPKSPCAALLGRMLGGVAGAPRLAIAGLLRNKANRQEAEQAVALKR